MTHDLRPEYLAQMVGLAMSTPQRHYDAAPKMLERAIRFKELFYEQIRTLEALDVSDAAIVRLERKRDRVLAAALRLEGEYSLPFVPVVTFGCHLRPCEELVATVRYRGIPARLHPGVPVTGHGRRVLETTDPRLGKIPEAPYYAIGIRPVPGDDGTERPSWVASSEAMNLAHPPFTPLVTQEVLAYCLHSPQELETRWVAAAGSRIGDGPDGGWPTVGRDGDQVWLMPANDCTDPDRQPLLPFTVPTCRMRV